MHPGGPGRTATRTIRGVPKVSPDPPSPKNLREGRAHGGLDQLRDSDVRLMVATDSEGRVEGVLSWLPTWRDGTVVGWTLDFMRRRSDAMPGLMEFLIAQSATLMKDEGIEFMSLSGAPLAGTGTTRTAGTGTGADGTSSTAANDRDSGALGDLLTFLSKTLEPVYGFQSLHRFKSKFQPRYETLYLLFRDEGDLPRIEARLILLGLMCLETALPWGGEVLVCRGASGWRLVAQASRTKPDPALWGWLDMAHAAQLPAPNSSDVHFPLLAGFARAAGRSIGWELDESGGEISF